MNFIFPHWELVEKFVPIFVIFWELIPKHFPTIKDDLNFTGDCCSNNEDGSIPVLDMKMKKGKRLDRKMENSWPGKGLDRKMEKQLWGRQYCGYTPKKNMEEPWYRRTGGGR